MTDKKTSFVNILLALVILLFIVLGAAALVSIFDLTVENIIDEPWSYWMSIASVLGIILCVRELKKVKGQHSKVVLVIISIFIIFSLGVTIYNLRPSYRKSEPIKGDRLIQFFPDYEFYFLTATELWVNRGKATQEGNLLLLLSGKNALSCGGSIDVNLNIDNDIAEIEILSVTLPSGIAIPDCVAPPGSYIDLGEPLISGITFILKDRIDKYYLEYTNNTPTVEPQKGLFTEYVQ